MEYVCDLPVEGMTSFVSGSTTIPVHEQVVRCRDCKYKAMDISDHEYRVPLYCVFHRMDVKPDNYCSWGKRRADA